MLSPQYCSDHHTCVAIIPLEEFPGAFQKGAFHALSKDHDTEGSQEGTLSGGLENHIAMSVGLGKSKHPDVNKVRKP